jgi:hypothetical protein
VHIQQVSMKHKSVISQQCINVLILQNASQNIVLLMVLGTVRSMMTKHLIKAVHQVILIIVLNAL